MKEINRLRRLRRQYRRDATTGLGCIGPRQRVRRPDGSIVYIPQTMIADPEYRPDMNRTAFDRLRLRHDFEFWAVTCCRIRDKTTGATIPFELNLPQVEVLSLLEIDRRYDRPMRLIMLKARQWGGSTLIQMYMAWIQCVIRRNWNSLICAHVKDTAASIRGMYSNMLALYPQDMWDDGIDDDDAPDASAPSSSAPRFRPFERSGNVREISGRGCRVTVGSSENQEAVRGADYAMAHLSEVAFWADSDRRSPENFIRAVCGAINRSPLTLIVMESTANGVGNFFHSEWIRAEKGLSDKRPVFVPWYKIDIYSENLPPGMDAAALWEQLDSYERALWDDLGLTLEQILWYHNKRREYPDHSMMKAEYPTLPSEAFANTGNAVFYADDIERLRRGCRSPAERGDFTGPVATGFEALRTMRFTPRPDGDLSVWRRPDRDRHPDDNRYLVTVDIGGRSHRSDYSVIAVFDRYAPSGNLELVAQWRGHCDHDILAWKAAAIGKWYHDALLVFESNTLETDNTEGDPSECILNDIYQYYDNLYRRPGGHLGFHTNRSTKSAIVTRLNSALRDDTLLERDTACCDELAVYRNRPDGTQGALPGHHDDMVVTRAIAVYVDHSLRQYEADPWVSVPAARAAPCGRSIFRLPG